MTTWIKRTMLAVTCAGLTAGVVVAQGGEKPATPPAPTSKEGVKDAAKNAQDALKKRADEVKKDVKDALKGGDKPKAPEGMPAMDPKMMEAMQAMEKLKTPGPMHEHLKKSAGSWDMALKFKMDPGGPWMESKATAKAEMIMDGHYLQEDVDGTFEMMGQSAPFKGRSTTAFDNGTNKFTNTWIDSESTGMMVSSGTLDAATHTTTLEGEAYDPMLGKVAKCKTTIQWKDDNTRYMEMWCTGPDGKLWNNMQITYTRKK